MRGHVLCVVMSFAISVTLATPTSAETTSPKTTYANGAQTAGSSKTTATVPSTTARRAVGAVSAARYSRGATVQPAPPPYTTKAYSQGTGSTAYTSQRAETTTSRSRVQYSSLSKTQTSSALTSTTYTNSAAKPAVGPKSVRPIAARNLSAVKPTALVLSDTKGTTVEAKRTPTTKANERDKRYTVTVRTPTDTVTVKVTPTKTTVQREPKR